MTHLDLWSCPRRTTMRHCSVNHIVPALRLLPPQSSSYDHRYHISIAKDPRLAVNESIWFGCRYNLRDIHPHAPSRAAYRGCHLSSSCYPFTRPPHYCYRRRYIRGSDSLMVTCTRPSSAEPTFPGYHCVPSETLALQSADDIFGMLKRIIHRV